jgi:surface antigen
MKRLFLAISAAAIALSAAHAYEPLASRETSALTTRDRLAAAQAEIETLDRDEVVNDFRWKGPDGAEGLIVVSGYFPTVYGMGNCRRLVHIIKHKDDGGVNPTFSGVVCRDWEGKWSLEKR